MPFRRILKKVNIFNEFWLQLKSEIENNDPQMLYKNVDKNEVLKNFSNQQLGLFALALPDSNPLKKDIVGFIHNHIPEVNSLILYIHSHRNNEVKALLSKKVWVNYQNESNMTPLAA